MKIVPEDLPLDDAKTYEVFGKGFTSGVFPKYPGPCSATLVHAGSPTFSMMSISPVAGQLPLPSAQNAGQRPAPTANFIRAATVP